jgi:uncharacterized protein YprB with RNaseH-like and TPR domain
MKRGLIQKGLTKGRKERRHPRVSGVRIESIFEPEEIGEGGETCLRFRHHNPGELRYGLDVPIRDLLAGRTLSGEIPIVSGETLAPREDLLFLDIETTGLAMGTGTYAFLVGLGYFEDDGFIVDQYFMRDFSEEECLLDLLGDAIAPFCQIVTFNGRSFDLQLLRNRYLMAGVSPPFDRKPDLDLLFLGRRFYRDRLENCRLTTIERDILGFHRVGDIDGSLIPDLYFRFLRTGEFPQLDLVLQHNVWDILSMAYLTHLFLESFRDPIGSANLHGGVFMRIGACLEEYGPDNDAMVERCYEEAMKSGIDTPDGYEAARRMSLLYRRRRDYDSASEIWQMMRDSDFGEETFPHVELAKHCEHRLKDYRRAIRLVNDAMRILEAADRRFSQFWLASQREELLYRLARLERRLERSSQD